MYAFEIIAERRIKEAMDRGDFDNLPGKGKPLPPDGLDNLPPDMRMAYTIMKNAGVIPEEVELLNSISSIQHLIRICHAEDERNSLRARLSVKQFRYAILVEKRTGRIVDHDYHCKIMEKLR
jgi:hypothetical protein